MQYDVRFSGHKRTSHDSITAKFRVYLFAAELVAPLTKFEAATPKRSDMTIKSNIVSGRQLRAARALTGLTQAELSTKAGFAVRACRYWESRGDAPPTSIPQSLESIEAVLRHHGVEVFSSPTPGCRLASTK